MSEKEWIAIGKVKGDKGDTGVGTVIKGGYYSLDDLIGEHPTGSESEAYLVDGSFYF